MTGGGREPVAAVLLAAGESRRMRGLNKLTLKLDGVPLVRRALDTLLAAGIDEVVVVLGHEATRVRACLDPDGSGLPAGVRCLVHEAYASGQAGTVLAGLAAMRSRGCPVLVALGDMPLLAPDDVRGLLEAYAARAPGADVVVPRHEGQRGNPVIFSARAVGEILLAAAPGGARAFVDANPGRVQAYETAHDHFTFDLDTPEDVPRLAARIGRPVGP